jgi:hypothetical protein
MLQDLCSIARQVAHHTVYLRDCQFHLGVF